jgi:hypothetical protein
VLGKHAWRCDWRLYTQKTQSESESESEGARAQIDRQADRNRKKEQYDKILSEI